ncbi:MAG: S8 family serine peptidase [Bacteroides sp.]|nr:S8 family serine peptidase [Bacteroides sp.]
MERKPLLKRLLACALAAAVTVNGFVIPTLADDGSSKSSFTKVSNDSVSAQFPGREKVAADEETSPYLDSDIVRVSIVLEDKSTIEAGYDVDTIADDAAAVNYREKLAEGQEKIIGKIERVTEKNLEVVWGLTLAANLISANVEYGEIEKIKNISGVKEVVIETQYYPAVLDTPIANDPNMATSGAQTGSLGAWAAGYTGAGARIAIVDTGTDYTHQSFSEAGYLHSLELQAEEKGKTLEAYMSELGLLTKAEIDSVKDKLNAGNVKYSDHLSSVAAVDSSKAYLSAKLPYAYNYVDGDYDVDHDRDDGGAFASGDEHGSHVAGISAANTYVKTADGFVEARTALGVEGVAPDAQILTFKVFGKNGGAYDSDYMAAIEDAIVLKADSINLSLGSANPGRSTMWASADQVYQTIMDNLTKSGVVVSISAGNAGAWYENTAVGALYADDVSMATNGSPGSYTNSLCVASADNIGGFGSYLEVGDDKILFNENEGEGYDSILSLAGKTLEYVMIDGYGSEEEWAALGENALKGKVAICSRGNGINFADKANWAVEAGAIATIIYNNVPGAFGMLTTGYKYKAPMISVSQESAAILRANAEKVDVQPAAQSEEADEELEETEVTEAPEAEEETEVTEAPEAAEEAEASEETEAAEAEEAPEENEPVEEEAQETDEEEASEEAQADTKAPYYYAGTLKPNKDKVAVYTGDYVQLSSVSSFSSFGVPGSLEMKPEITAPGGNIYSVNGDPAGNGKAYENMSGTSMAAPQIAGMAALAAQYVRNTGLAAKTHLSSRVLIQSLLMSTAVPLLEDVDGEGTYSYYPVIRQGAGLANINSVISAESYILMNEDATASYADGKVKAELGDDPDRNGEYTFSFTVNNITGVDQSYALDAQLFTQYMYAYQGAAYTDSTTELIGTVASFVCDGTETDEITVPAGDSVEVEVTLAISSSDKAYYDSLIDGGLTNGIYVEGYVFVESLGDDEGVLGVDHSIPVLGFYGNWTDPSMYDVGSYIEYKHGLETRAPYLGNANVNAFGISYADEPGSTYYFGGNPLITDEEYMPERNAINSSTVVSIVSFAAIRNAEAAYFALFSDGLEQPFAANMGAVDAAFYHDNQGRWYYTSNTKTIGLSPAQLGLQEDDELEIDLILVPEYYVGRDGSVALNKVGDGAYLTVPAVVDDTEPEVSDIVLDEENDILTVTASDNQYIAAVVLYNRTGELVLSYAPSKEDIAAGAEAEYKIDVSGIKGTEFYVQVADYAMNAVTYKLDETIGSDIPLPDMLAFYAGRTSNNWVGIGEYSGMKIPSIYMPSTRDFIAATIAEHYVFAVDGTNGLYVMPEDDLDNMIKITDITVGTITDMAYNPADGNLYGVCGSSSYSVLVSIDKLTGEAEPAYIIPVMTNTLACDRFGNFYFNVYGSNMVGKFNLDLPEDEVVVEPELLCEVEGIGSTKYLQSMEVDPNNDVLCWTSCNADGEAYYVEIDTESGEAEVYNDLGAELYSLIIPDKTVKDYDFDGDGDVDEDDGVALLDLRVGNRDSISNEENADFDSDGDIDTHDAYLFFNMLLWSKPTSVPTQVALSDSSIKLFRNGQYQLTATVSPWTLSDRSVTWSSSDATVASVSQSGVVSALNVGKATITAASKLDGTVLATCEVTVESVAATASGALQDEDAKPLLFEWNMETASKWSEVAPLTMTSILSADEGPDGNAYIIDGSANNLYVIDPATGETLEMGAGEKLPLSDFAFSEVFADGGKPVITGVYAYLVMALQDPMTMADRFYTLEDYLDQMGSYYLMGITTLGATDFYDEEDDATYTAERFVAIDDQGLLWNLFFVGGNLWAFEVYDSNMPADFLGNSTDVSGCSLTYGEDGYLYLAACDMETTSRIYRIEIDDENAYGEVMYLGSVGADVWPAALLSVKSNASAPASKTADSFIASSASSSVSSVAVTDSSLTDDGVSAAAVYETETVELKRAQPVKESGLEKFASTFALASVDVESSERTVEAPVQISPMSELDGTTDEIVVELTAQNANNDNISSTNGLFIVTYSPEAMEFAEVVSPEGVYNAYRVDEEAGKLIVAYVSPVTPIPEDEAAQLVEFNVLDESLLESAVIGIIHAETNGRNYVEDIDDPDNAGSGGAPSEDLPVVETTTEAPKPVVGSGSGNFTDPFVTTAATTAPVENSDATTAPAQNPDTTTAPSEAANGEGGSTAPADTTAAPDAAGTNGGSENGSGSAGNGSSDASESGGASNGGSDNVGNDSGANAGEDKNQNTGLVLCFVPAAASAIAVLVSKKRRK